MVAVNTPTDSQVIVRDRNPAKFSQGERARLGYRAQSRTMRTLFVAQTNSPIAAQDIQQYGRYLGSQLIYAGHAVIAYCVDISVIVKYVVAIH